MQKTKEEITREYNNLISTLNAREQDFQEFFEKNPQSIPINWMLNHQIHYGLFLSKPSIKTFRCDLAYITKSSREWQIVLIEIEKPTSSIFNKDGEFSKDYNHAKRQILDWKAEIKKSGILNCFDYLMPLIRPMEKNPISVKYAIIIGRENDINNQGPDANIRLQDDLGDDIKISTFDSPILRINNFDGNIYNTCHIVDKKIRFKYLNGDSLNAFFGYTKNHEVNLNDEDICKLKDWEYDIDSWLKGEMLSINNKKPFRKTPQL